MVKMVKRCEGCAIMRYRKGPVGGYGFYCPFEHKYIDPKVDARCDAYTRVG